MQDNTPALGFAVLYVADLASALTYFTEKLGFVRVPEQSDPHFHFLVGGNGGIPFGIGQASDATAPAGSVELGFKTPDVDALHTTYTEKDVLPSLIEANPFGRSFTLPPLNGITLEFWADPVA